MKSRSFEVATRVGGDPPHPHWARPLSRGPLEAPLTDFFRLYIPIYPKTIEDKIEWEFCRRKPL